MPKVAAHPVKRNQVLAKDVALGEARLLDDFAQLHVVQHFHAQRPVSPDRVIDRTPDHIERAHSHVVLRPGISHFPRTMPENKERLKKGNHHSLARVLHDHARKKHHVIGFFGFGIGDRASHRVRLEQNVGVGEEQPVACRLLAAVHMA